MELELELEPELEPELELELGLEPGVGFTFLHSNLLKLQLYQEIKKIASLVPNYTKQMFTKY